MSQTPAPSGAKNETKQQTEKERSERKEPRPMEATPVTASDAPEEDNVSRTPEDNRPPNQTQPPTKDQY